MVGSYLSLLSTELPIFRTLLLTRVLVALYVICYLVVDTWLVRFYLLHIFSKLNYIITKYCYHIHIYVHVYP